MPPKVESSAGSTRRERDDNSSQGSTPAHQSVVSQTQEQARTAVAAQLLQAVDKFATTQPAWRWGFLITDKDKLIQSGLCSEFVSWLEEKQKGGLLTETNIGELFCARFCNLLSPNFNFAEKEAIQRLQQAIKDVLWVEVLAIWDKWRTFFQNALLLTEFLQRERKSILGFSVLASNDSMTNATARVVRVDDNNEEQPVYFHRLAKLGFTSDFIAGVGLKVHIINGPSGSGKSVLSLQYAFYQGNNIVFFFNANFAGWSEETEVCGVKYCDIDWSTASDHQRHHRNNAAFSAICRSVRELLTSDSGIGFIKDETPVTPGCPQVVLVFDDIGQTPVLLRALRATSVDIAKEVARTLFGDHPRHAERVHFVATGTGANAVIQEPGSSKDNYQALTLTREHSAFAQLVQLWFSQTPTIKQLLDRLAISPSSNLMNSAWNIRRNANNNNNNNNDIEDPPEFLSPNELVAADVNTNLRAAALFLQQPFKLSKSPSNAVRAILASYPAYDQFVGSWLNYATMEYIRLNGLSKFAYPLAALRYGFVTAVFRLPFLPLVRGLLPPEQDTLPYALSAIGGILVDGARAVLERNVRMDEFDVRDAVRSVRRNQRVVGLDVANHLVDSAGTGKMVVVADKCGRYKFAEAQCGMIRTVEGIPPRNAHFSSFEEVLGEFCRMIAGSSFYIETITNSFTPQNRDDVERFNDEVNEKVDPLFTLKQWLRFGLNISGAVMFELGVSAISKFDEFCELAESHYRRYVRSLSRVVVLQCKEREPFADIVVLGPNKVILLQAKRFTSSDSGIDFDKEFLKMCAVHSSHDEKGQEPFMEKPILTKKKKVTAQERVAHAVAMKKYKHHARRRLVQKLAEICQVDANKVTEVYCCVVLGISVAGAYGNAATCKSVLDKYRAAFNDAKKKYKSLAEGRGYKVVQLQLFAFDARNTNPLHPISLYADDPSQQHVMVGNAEIDQ